MGASNSVMKGLQSDFRTGRYSDMRVIAGDGTVYHVHKVVLCHQSLFFENAMKEGRFKEGHENTIHLEDKDSVMVYAMLFYLYHQCITYSRDCRTAAKRALFHLDLLALADEYMIASLREDVLNKLKNLDDTLSTPELGSVMSDFPRLVQAAYTKVPDKDKQLRLIFARLAANNALELMSDEEFRQLLRNLPDFAIDLTESLANNNENLSLKIQETRLLEAPIN